MKRLEIKYEIYLHIYEYAFDAASWEWKENRFINCEPSVIKFEDEKGGGQAE